MVRPWRVEFESAVYHVMCRGVARGKIFRDRQDYERFEECLSAAADKFDLSVYAYVLMPNHYHLFLRTRKANLSRAVQHMQSCYAMCHNRKHHRVGHLFQGRFKSILVEDESYFAVLSAYVHLNPVRRGLVKRVEEYGWSSYSDYVGGKKRHTWVEPADVLAQSGGDKTQQRQRYREWLEGMSGRERNVLGEVKRGFVLGSLKFVKWIVAKFGAGSKAEMPSKRGLCHEEALERVVAEAKKVFGVGEDEIRSNARGRSKEARDAAMCVLVKHTGLRGRAIGEAFGVKPAAVSLAARRASERMAESKNFARAVKDLRDKSSRLLAK